MPAASFTYRAASLLVCACAALSLAPVAVAAPGGLPTNVQHTDSSPQWEKLRTALFQDRKVEAGTGKV
ncbi:MAG: hypothetical protein H0W38_15320, partial [Methylibium sp.]|nr:hypothetical protein [Methylibium sp.]